MIRHPFSSLDFNDRRLAKRANSVLSAMTGAGSSVINRIFRTFAEKTAAYRMINNEKVTCTSITEAYKRSCRERVQECGCRHVLCLQDTCEINYEAHALRMHKKGRKPGCVSNGEAGCFLHPTLAIDPQTLAPYGFTSIAMWNREEGARNCYERAYKRLSPEEKESFRWSRAMDETRALIGGEVAVTMLSDRESDIYEVLKRADEDVRIVLRSNQNRRVKNHGAGLHDMMGALPPSGTYRLSLPPSHGRRARVAEMEVRYAPVELERPANLPKAADMDVRLNCIRVSEVPGSVPQGGKPVEWILLTNHKVESAGQALQCVSWYRCRWYIEELFRLLKKKGFAIEDIQLEDTECIEKDILFSAYAAMRCILLKHAFDNPGHYGQVPARCAFSPTEVQTAEVMLHRLNGRTVKQQNPYTRGSLSWISWIVARIGCWTGYYSQPRPGYITFRNGLYTFYNYCEMYGALKDVYKG